MKEAQQKKNWTKEYVVYHLSPMVLAAGIALSGGSAIFHKQVDDYANTRIAQIEKELDEICEGNYRPEDIEGLNACIETIQPIKEERVREVREIVRPTQDLINSYIFGGIAMSISGIGIKVIDSIKKRRKLKK